MVKQTIITVIVISSFIACNRNTSKVSSDNPELANQPAIAVKSDLKPDTPKRVSYQDAPFGTNFGKRVHIKDNIWGDKCETDECMCGQIGCHKGEICALVPVSTSTCAVSNLNCDDRYLEYRPEYKCYCNDSPCSDDTELQDDEQECTNIVKGESCSERGDSICAIRSCIEGECQNGVCLCGAGKIPCKPNEQCVDGQCTCRGEVCSNGEHCGYTGCVCGDDMPALESDIIIPEGYPFAHSCHGGSCTDGACICGNRMCNPGESCHDAKCTCDGKHACPDGFYCMGDTCRCTNDPLHYHGLASCGDGICHNGLCKCNDGNVCRRGEACIDGHCDNVSSKCKKGEYFSKDYAQCLCGVTYEEDTGDAYPFSCDEGTCVNGKCLVTNN